MPTGADSPNGDFEMYSMIRLISYQLAQIVTNPNPVYSGWYDFYIHGIAYKCFSNSGKIQYFWDSDYGLKKYTEVVGSRKFYLQTLWDIGSNPQKCNFDEFIVKKDFKIIINSFNVFGHALI